MKSVLPFTGGCMGLRWLGIKTILTLKFWERNCFVQLTALHCLLHRLGECTALKCLVIQERILFLKNKMEANLIYSTADCFVFTSAQKFGWKRFDRTTARHFRLPHSAGILVCKGIFFLPRMLFEFPAVFDF